MEPRTKNSRLILMRHGCNLTQTGVAVRARVSLPTVNRAELGHAISPASRELLCQFFSDFLNRPVGPEELGLLPAFPGPLAPDPHPEQGATQEPLPSTIILLSAYRERHRLKREADHLETV
jgi:hypothetical protein